MPNHCETDLTLKGKPALVAKVLAAHFKESGELNCDSVIPYPAHLKALDEAAAAWDKFPQPKDWKDRPKDGFNQGGYEWCVSNWGTKWGTYDGAGITRMKSGFKTSFNSAWSPPHPVLAKLAAMYPDLEIVAKSYEMGAGYKCDVRWKGGKIVRNITDNAYRGSRGG